MTEYYKIVKEFFLLKKWAGTDELYMTWARELSSIPVIYVQRAFAKAKTETGHVDCTKIATWARLNQSESKHARYTPKKTKRQFCRWCLDLRDFTNTPDGIALAEYYCTVCSSQYDNEKNPAAEKLLVAGNLDEIKKCRDYILVKPFIAEMRERYLQKMINFKNDAIYSYTI